MLYFFTNPGTLINAMTEATISLKQLRTNPREYIRLLNSGVKVNITEHRKSLVRAAKVAADATTPRGDITRLLQTLTDLPSVNTPFPDMDTLELIKQARLEQYPVNTPRQQS